MTGPEFTVFMYDQDGEEMSITVPTNCFMHSAHGVWLTIPGDSQYLYPWHRIICIARRDKEFTNVNEPTKVSTPN